MSSTISNNEALAVEHIERFPRISRLVDFDVVPEFSIQVSAGYETIIIGIVND
jgi:hypothetical protein